jgi:hypothetical protein
MLIYHHSHHRGNVTAPYECPNLSSWLHLSHNQKGGPRSLYGHVVAWGEEKKKIKTNEKEKKKEKRKNP